MQFNDLDLDRYEVISSITSDEGEASVVLARERLTDVLATVKWLDPNSLFRFEQQLRNLKREAHILKVLEGSGVPKLLAYSLEKNSPYIVTEYIGDRFSVKTQIPESPLLDKIEILIQFFRCLAIAHSKNIANLDLDFRHIYWMGEVGRLVVIDWGNAKFTSSTKDFAYDLYSAAYITYQLLVANTISSYSFPDLDKISDIPISFRQLFEWASENKGRFSPPTQYFPWSAASLKESSKRWKSELLCKDGNDILTIYFYMPDQISVAKYSIVQEIVDELEWIHLIISVLIHGDKETALSIVKLKHESSDYRSQVSPELIHRIYPNEEIHPLKLVSIEYGSPISVDLLGISSVLGAIRDIIKDISWRAKHEKQLANLELQDKQVGVEKSNQDIYKAKFEIESQMLANEKLRVDIISKKLELLKEIQNLQISDEDRDLIASSIKTNIERVAQTVDNLILQSEQVVDLE